MPSYTLSLTGAEIDAVLTSEPQTYGSVNQTGVPSFDYGGNVSSVADISLGRTTANFTSSYAANDWGHTCATGFGETDRKVTGMVFSKTTLSTGLLCYQAGGVALGDRDTLSFGFSLFGDLA
jgi:hypothetical protein